MKYFLPLIILALGCGPEPEPLTLQPPEGEPVHSLDRECAPGALYGAGYPVSRGTVVTWRVAVTGAPADALLLSLEVAPQREEVAVASGTATLRITSESQANALGGVQCPDGAASFLAEMWVN